MLTRACRIRAFLDSNVKDESLVLGLAVVWGPRVTGPRLCRVMLPGQVLSSDFVLHFGMDWFEVIWFGRFGRAGFMVDFGYGRTHRGGGSSGQCQADP